MVPQGGSRADEAKQGDLSQAGAQLPSLFQHRWQLSGPCFFHRKHKACTLDSYNHYTKMPLKRQTTGCTWQFAEKEELRFSDIYFSMKQKLLSNSLISPSLFP